MIMPSVWYGDVAFSNVHMHAPQIHLRASARRVLGSGVSEHNQDIFEQDLKEGLFQMQLCILLEEGLRNCPTRLQSNGAE